MKAHALAVALVAVALVSASHAAPPILRYAPADGQSHADHSLPRWESYSANPAYEVFGTEDAQGVFRYTASRLKAPTINFGVKLPTAGEAPTRMALGNDPDMARALMARAPAGFPSSMGAAATAKAKSKAPCGHSDCDGGQCKRKPKPKPAPDVEIDIGHRSAHHWEPWHIAVAVVGGLITLALGVLFLLVVVVLIIWVFRGAHRAVSGPANAPPANPQ